MNVDPYADLTLFADLSALLTAAGVGPCVFGPITQLVDAGVGITIYPVSDDEETGNATVGVQVRIRGVRNGGAAEVSRWQNLTLNALTHTDPFRLPSGVVISLSARQMSAPLGLDGQGRCEVADTYYMRRDRRGLSG